MLKPWEGPGKYDDECTEARRSAKAVGCVLIVIEGDRGNGFSFQTLDQDLLPVLPTLLRTIADDIAEQLKAGST